MAAEFVVTFGVDVTVVVGVIVTFIEICMRHKGDRANDVLRVCTIVYIVMILTGVWIGLHDV